MVFTRRKNLENSPEKAGLKSAKVSKNGGTARKVIRSASKAAFKIDRVSETERVTENERENSLKPTSPERDVETAAFNDDEMQENVTPYSLSNPVYQELENVRHNDFLFAHVKGEHASTPKIPKLIPTPRFVKKENYSTGSFRGLNEESTSNSSPFSNGLKDYPVVVTPSQPCPTPSYSHRLTPFYSETGVRERPTHFSTQNNTWDPVGFAANNLYDLTTGIPLPRLECEENLTKLAKNVRDTDYYVFLQLAQRFHNVNRDMEMLALGQAFNAAMLNKMTSRLRQAEQKNETLERESDIIKGIGFDLKKATEVEVPVELPCRKTFKISTIITAVEASKWTSSRFYGDSKNLFRFVFKAIAKRDDFFAGYSAQDNSNVGYVPYGDKFYKPIVDFVLAGFRQPRDVNTLTSLHCAARESMTNLLDRFRKEYKEKMQSTAKEVADSLKDHLFHLSLVEDSSYQEPLDFTDSSPAHADFTCLK